MKYAANVIAVLIMIAIFAGIVWLTMKIPCGFYKYTQVSGVPARCIAEFAR